LYHYRHLCHCKAYLLHVITHDLWSSTKVWYLTPHASNGIWWLPVAAWETPFYNTYFVQHSHSAWFQSVTTVCCNTVGIHESNGLPVLWIAMLPIIETLSALWDMRFSWQWRFTLIHKFLWSVSLVNFSFLGLLAMYVEVVPFQHILQSLRFILWSPEVWHRVVW
jgi:hypothetical protein